MMRPWLVDRAEALFLIAVTFVLSFGIAVGWAYS